MKKLLFVLTVAALAVTPLMASPTEPGQGATVSAVKQQKQKKQLKHQKKPLKKHAKKHPAAQAKAKAV